MCTRIVEFSGLRRFRVVNKVRIIAITAHFIVEVDQGELRLHWVLIRLFIQLTISLLHAPAKLTQHKYVDNKGELKLMLFKIAHS